MKIYKYSWIDGADLTQHRYTSSKTVAERATHLLEKKRQLDSTIDEESDDIPSVKCVFDIQTLELENKTKRQIIRFLNTHFSETQ